MSAFKRCLWSVGVVLLMCGNVAARAPAPEPFTLIVIPERANLVQASFDLVAHRSVAVATYRKEPATDRLRLHGWTGEQWIPIATEEYEGGQFLLREPERIILVGDDRLLPIALVQASDWGPLVMSVETLETDEYLNTMGQLFEFTASEWRWFARRYNMALEDQTPPRSRVSWYDQMSAAHRQPQRRHAGDLPPTRDIEPAPVVSFEEPRREEDRPEKVPMPEPQLEPVMDFERMDAMDEDTSPVDPSDESQEEMFDEFDPYVK